MLYEKIKGDPQARFYLSKCKYCGNLFIKFENKTLYCKDTCRCNQNQDNKARYQRKRRKLIRDGELVSNESQKLGTTYFPKHIKSDWTEEHKLIIKEKRKAGII